MNSKLEIEPGELTYTKELGRGTAAVVYEGVYKNNKVAIKQATTFFNEDDLENERDILAFLMDANLSNDYVIKLLGYEFTYEGCLLVLELMEETLTKAVNAKKLDTPLQQSIIIKKLAQGLQFIHNMNVVHRDIKPDNILINTITQDVKFCDFGSSFIWDPTKPNYLMLAGTPLYMAPEVLIWLDVEDPPTHIYDKPVDVYSLSISIWFIYSKREPYLTYNTKKELVRAVACRDHREEIPKSAPNEVRYVIEHGWFSAPTKRLTAQQIVESLQSLKV